MLSWLKVAFRQNETKLWNKKCLPVCLRQLLRVVKSIHLQADFSGPVYSQFQYIEHKGRVANPRPVAKIKTGLVSQPITDADDETGRDRSCIATCPRPALCSIYWNWLYTGPALCIASFFHSIIIIGVSIKRAPATQAHRPHTSPIW